MKYSRASYLVPAGERRQAIVQQTTVAEKEMLLLLVAVGGHLDEEEEHLMLLITLSIEVTSLGEKRRWDVKGRPENSQSLTVLQRLL